MTDNPPALIRGARYYWRGQKWVTVKIADWKYALVLDSAGVEFPVATADLRPELEVKAERKLQRYNKIKEVKARRLLLRQP